MKIKVYDLLYNQIFAAQREQAESIISLKSNQPCLLMSISPQPKEDIRKAAASFATSPFKYAKRYLQAGGGRLVEQYQAADGGSRKPDMEGGGLPREWAWRLYYPVRSGAGGEGILLRCLNESRCG